MLLVAASVPQWQIRVTEADGGFWLSNTILIMLTVCAITPEERVWHKFEILCCNYLLFSLINLFVRARARACAHVRDKFCLPTLNNDRMFDAMHETMAFSLVNIKR